MTAEISNEKLVVRALFISKLEKERGGNFTVKKYSLWKKIVLGISAASLVGGGILTSCSSQGKPTTTATSIEVQKTENNNDNKSKGDSKVYMTKAINPSGLQKVYEALGRKATGKVAVKISTGEPGGNYYLSPDLIKGLVQSVNGTIVECNTAYGGGRTSTEMHKQVAKDHGFAAIANVDIMDEDDSLSIPVKDGKRLKEDLVGSHLANYDFVMVLSHFKGHMMGGFGGAIKNISIGIGSQKGKNLIHTGGNTTEPWMPMMNTLNQDNFLEAMAEAGKAVSDYEGNGSKMLYISVMNNLSIDCDCASNPAKPEIADIGILASTDPVALDQACVDLASKAPGSQSLVNRINDRHGVHTLEHAEEIGLGSRKYQLESIDG